MIKFKKIIEQDILHLCEYLESEYSIKVKDVIPDENKPFSKIFKKNKKELLLSDYSSLETKKLHAAAQIAQEGAIKKLMNIYLNLVFHQMNLKH